MTSPIGTRRVLVANIGQYDSVLRLIPAASLQTVNSNDTSAGASSCTIFATRDKMSTALGDPVFSPFSKNSQLFLRRVRVASELQTYGAKLRNRGGLDLVNPAIAPTLWPNSSWFSLWANELSSGNPISQIWASYEIPMLNEWYDINQLVYPFGAGDPGQDFFLSTQCNLDIDFTDSPSRIIGGAMQLRIEIEVDMPNGQFLAPPALPPTLPKSAGIFSIDEILGTSTLGAQTIFRQKLSNQFGQAITKLRIGYQWTQAGGMAPLVAAAVGVGPFGGDHNLQAATWQSLAFGGNPGVVPGGSYSLASPGVFISDPLTMSSPIAPGDPFVLSTGFGVGDMSIQTADSSGASITPLSGWILDTRAALANAADVTLDHAFNSQIGQPTAFLIAEF